MLKDDVFALIDRCEDREAALEATIIALLAVLEMLQYTREPVLSSLPGSDQEDE